MMDHMHDVMLALIVVPCRLWKFITM